MSESSKGSELHERFIGMTNAIGDAFLAGATEEQVRSVCEAAIAGSVAGFEAFRKIREAQKR